MSVDFFQEIINHKLVERDRYVPIINCYGISREPKTGNYMMAIQYAPEGNLRKFLQNNYKQLNFQDRFRFCETHF